MFFLFYFRFWSRKRIVWGFWFGSINRVVVWEVVWNWKGGRRGSEVLFEVASVWGVGRVVGERLGGRGVIGNSEWGFGFGLEGRGWERSRGRFCFFLVMGIMVIIWEEGSFIRYLFIREILLKIIGVDLGFLR